MSPKPEVLDDDEFHVFDEPTRTTVTADSVENLISRLRQHRQRLAMGPMAYEQARATVCHKYPDDCKVAALGVVESIKHLGKSLKTWNDAGRPTVDDDTYAKRKATCLVCPNLAGWKATNITYCRLCKCGTGVISLKLKMATEQCPDNPPRWKAIANT